MAHPHESPTLAGKLNCASGAGQMSGLNRRDLIHLAIVLAIAIATRFYKLGYASLWLDEAFTIRISNYSFSTLWVTNYDPSPPLYYSLIQLLLNFGHSEYLLRLPSAIFGVLTIAVIYIATRRIAGPLAALSACLILSLSSFNIEYSQEARFYALLGLCLSVSFLGLANLSQRWQSTSSGFTFREFLRCGGALYALGLIAALYTHNTAVFYWLGVQFFFIGWWFRPFRLALPVLAAWFVVNFIVLLLWIPWLNASLERIAMGGFSWLPQASALDAMNQWRSIHGMSSVLPGQPGPDLIKLLLGVVGIYSLRRYPAMAVLLSGLLVFSSIAIWAFGFVGTPVYMHRTILWGTLFSSVVVGIGISRFPPTIAYCFIMLVAIEGGLGVNHYFKYNVAESEDWRFAAEIFNKHQKPNDILLIREPFVHYPFFYYVDEFSPDWTILGWDCLGERALTGRIKYGAPIPTIKWSKSDIFGTDKPISQKEGAALWLVEAHCLSRDWDTSDATFLPNWRLRKSYDFKGGYLHHLVPAARR
ncbi:MAG: hypothetical protein HOC23_18400 [Halieaceae bacterium]|nr:hypothetical protein [Halieaceae bacterium]